MVWWMVRVVVDGGGELVRGRELGHFEEEPVAAAVSQSDKPSASTIVVARVL